MREAGRRQVMIGLAIAGVGLVVTVASYSASSGGGTYLVFWGAIIFGLIRAGRGVAMMSKAKSAAATAAPHPGAAPISPPPQPPHIDAPQQLQVERSAQLPAPPSSMWD
jgi:hypothetical protein